MAGIWVGAPPRPMPHDCLTWSLVDLALGVLALLIALAALGCAVVGLRRTAVVKARRGKVEAGAAGLPDDVQGLRHEVSALRMESAEALRHVSVVRYDAFGDMGGHLSWSIALLDDAGDGVVLTSIHGRNDARTYAKNVTRWTCEQQLSPEEEDAIARARI